MNNRFLAFATLIALAACQSPNTSTTNRAQLSMIGMNREQVLACAGVPSSSMKVGNTEVWRYVALGATEGDVSASSSSLGGFSSTRGSIEANVISCEVSVRFTDGRASELNYARSGDHRVVQGGLLNVLAGEKYPECAWIVSRCVIH